MFQILKRLYYELIYAKTFESLEEINKLLDKYDLPKLNLEKQKG